MTDPYANLREQLHDGAANAASMIMRQYQPRIEEAQQRGQFDLVSELSHRMQLDITRTTRPFVRTLEKLPGPPMLLEGVRNADGSYSVGKVMTHV